MAIEPATWLVSIDPFDYGTGHIWNPVCQPTMMLCGRWIPHWTGVQMVQVRAECEACKRAYATYLLRSDTP